MNYSEMAGRLPKKLLNDFPEEIRALSNGHTFLDVRSPSEYAKGCIPNSVNLPILDDLERESVGKAYKEHGKEFAIKMGHRLVSGDSRQTRIEAWKTYLKAQPTAHLICWRGGLRSKIAQDWLKQSGIQTNRMSGGYKALRNSLISVIESISQATRPVYVVGGQTGSKKTVVIQRLNTSIDLEGLARHRGSAFGALDHKQPTPINFENELALKLLTHQHNHIVVEDESKTIGRLAVPDELFARMKEAPIALVRVPLAERVEHIYNEYIKDAMAAGSSAQFLSEQYLGALNRIQRRLGGDRHSKLTKQITSAFTDGTDSIHQEWIESLLKNYYDPMYDYQIKKKQSRITFSGSPDEVTEYLQSKD